MNKRILSLSLSLIGTAALVALPLSAQDATDEADAAVTTTELTPWTCPTGFEGQTLNIFNWGTYISNEDDPATDVNENLVQNFEQLCGVTVNYEDTMESSEALVALLRGGNPGYDLSMPAGYSIPLLVEEGLVQPINLENIPNAANLRPELAGAWYDPENQYSLPYFWGTIGIGYNRATVGEDVTSWEQMWSYGGPVAWLEDRNSVIGVALLMLGFDPNTEDLDEIAQARDYLIANSGNVVSIAQDDGQVLLQRGDVDMTIEYMGDIFQIQAECQASTSCTDDFQYVIPQEGAPFWVDNMVVPTGAPNQPLAEVFMDYMYDPQIAALNANYVQFASPNQASADLGLINADQLNNPGIYPPPEITERLFEVEDRVNVETDISDAWEEVRLDISS